MMFKILIIEDEIQISDIVATYLRNEGHEVLSAYDGIDGLAVFADSRPQLVILDVMMPGISGFDVLHEIRQVSPVPVIMLTAKQEEVDKLSGFNLGADDYISKPFSPKELVKRVEAVLRRTYTPLSETAMLVSGDFMLDIVRQKLFKHGIEIEITAKEFQVLRVFFSNAGALLSRQQLIDKAFGDEYDGFDRNIDSYIKNIRQKIEDNARSAVYLKTKYGAGYVFEGNKHDH